MDRILECKVCGKRFVALRRDATTCSARCRKKQSRTMAADVKNFSAEDFHEPPEPVVTLPVTLPPPEPARVQVFTVPTGRDDQFGRLEDFVQCESPEAATHWDARAWRNNRDR